MRDVKRAATMVIGIAVSSTASAQSLFAEPETDGIFTIIKMVMRSTLLQLPQTTAVILPSGFTTS